MSNVIKFLAILSLAIGVRVYSKSSNHDDIKNQILAACEDNQRCVDAVNEKYESCFDNAYSMGRRSHFNEDQFLKCMGE
jgi:hypothetical protein